MDKRTLEAILGRPAAMPWPEEPLKALRPMSVLITGARGSIGSVLETLLLHAGVAIVNGTDIEDLDVTNATVVDNAIHHLDPDVIIHLAGDKYATSAEQLPYSVTNTNVIGTHNVLQAARNIGARVVVASTCKAIEPQTAYGASKLIAEKMTLNDGQIVARFYNVVETQGNVFDIWSQIPEDEPIPVTNCSRYFISLAESIGLLLWSAFLGSGRYTLVQPVLRHMTNVASAVYPGRDQVVIPARRGDRTVEPRIGLSEWAEATPSLGIMRVISSHDQGVTNRETALSYT